MKVLVTGGAGFIGSHIVDKLMQQGCEVVIVDNLSSGKKHNINNKARFYHVDIQSQELQTIFEKETPDYVSHQAAQIDVRRSVSDPIFDASINVLGTLNILENCIRNGVKKIIFASSGGAVYGEQESFPATEMHLTRPVSPYGVTKLAVEFYLHYYRVVHGLDYVALRYSNVYGPRQDPFGEAGVVAIFIQKMLNGEQPVINGDGEQTRDFIYVEDVAMANILALTNDVSENILNIGTSVETTVKQLFFSLRDIVKSPLYEKYGLAKQGEQRRSVITYEKAERVLGWKPQTPLVNGLRNTVDYFLNTH